MRTPFLPLLLVACSTTAALAGEARVDPQGDPLPEGALARLGTLRWSQGRSVAFQAFLPGGKQFLTVDHTGALGEEWNARVCRWEVPTGKLLGSFFAVPDTWAEQDAHCWGDAALSPDGKALVISDHRGIYVWDVASGKQLLPLRRGILKGLHGLTFAPGGDFIAGWDGRNVVAWDRKTGALVAELCPPTPDPLARVTAVCVRGSGKAIQIVQQTKTECRILAYEHSAEWKLCGTVPVEDVGGIDRWKLTWSPDGNSLLAEEREWSGVKLIDPDTGKIQRALDSADGLVKCHTFSHDGKLLFTHSGGNSVVIREVATGKGVKALGPPVPKTKAEQVPPPPRWMAASHDGCWLAETWGGQDVAVRDLGDNTVHSREGRWGRELEQLGIAPDDATAWTLTNSPFGGGNRGGLRKWDLATGREVSRPQSVWAPDSSLVVSPCGRYGMTRFRVQGTEFAACPIQWVLYSVGSRREILSLPVELSNSLSPCFAESGQYFAWVDHMANGVRVFESATGRSVGLLPFLEERPRGGRLSFLSDDGGRVVVEMDGAFFCGCVGAGKWHEVEGVVRREGEWLERGATRDGRLLLFVNERDQGLLYETATGRRRAALERVPGTKRAVFDGLVKSVAFSPDRRLLAFGLQGGAVEWWDVYSGTRLGESQGHLGAVHLVRFTPDGKRLVSGSRDSTALVWDAEPWRAKLARPAGLSARRRAECWDRVSGANAEAAWDAVRDFVRDPGAPEFLTERVKPAAGPDKARIGRFLRELDSNDFEVRQRAREGLEKEGRGAIPLIEAALNEKPPAEVRRQLEALLAELRDAALTTEELRQLRAVEVLEAHRAADALKKLAGGDRDAFLTREAREALQRLGGR